MTKTIDQLRRDATALKKAFHANDREAFDQVSKYLPPAAGQPQGQGPLSGPRPPLKHADFLHVIAREQGFASWPVLVATWDTPDAGLAALRQRLGLAITQGQGGVVAQLLAETPDLAKGRLGLCCGLYLLGEVAEILAADPAAATLLSPKFTPMIALARSRMIHTFPEREAQMLAIADVLLAQGADVNDATQDDHGRLSALYWAIGHGNNMALAEWLLDHGADPDDGESLYHATELGHHGGLRLLLAHGARVPGTNALLRAMDFGDVEAVRMLLAAGGAPDEGAASEGGVPVLHHAARRMASPEMVALLLDHGADPARMHHGVTAYAFARLFGNAALSRQLEALGHATDLSLTEALLAHVADGEVPERHYIDPEKMPPAARNIIREILHLPGKLPHVQRLVAVGVEYDRPDAQGITPVQIAGWEGLPDAMAYLLSLKPDLGHVNGYGGTLLTTILHGAENNPNWAERDYIACLRLALEVGVALPKRVLDHTDATDIGSFLRDWAQAHPGQVVEDSRQ